MKTMADTISLRIKLKSHEDLTQRLTALNMRNETLDKLAASKELREVKRQSKSRPNRRCFSPILSIDETGDDPTLNNSSNEAVITLQLLICTFDKCVKSKSVIEKDKTYVEVKCAAKCLIVFHGKCWNSFKEDVLSKDALGHACPTPDCWSFIMNIEIKDCSGNVKTRRTADDAMVKSVVKREIASMPESSDTFLTEPSNQWSEDEEPVADNFQQSLRDRSLANKSRYSTAFLFPDAFLVKLEKSPDAPTGERTKKSKRKRNRSQRTKVFTFNLYPDSYLEAADHDSRVQTLSDIQSNAVASFPTSDEYVDLEVSPSESPEGMECGEQDSDEDEPISGTIKDENNIEQVECRQCLTLVEEREGWKNLWQESVNEQTKLKDSLDEAEQKLADLKVQTQNILKDFTCVICQHDLAGRSILIGSCGHAFHNSCFRKWKRTDCVICRQDINGDFPPL